MNPKKLIYVLEGCDPTFTADTLLACGWDAIVSAEAAVKKAKGDSRAKEKAIKQRDDAEIVLAKRLLVCARIRGVLGWVRDITVVMTSLC